MALPRMSAVRPRPKFAKADDVCICPAGERLVHHFTNVEKGLTLRRNWTANGLGVCQGCTIKDRRTTGKERRITRWEHEHVVEAVERRLDEHPFGTRKSWMGATHLQMTTLEKVGTEMALHVPADNLKPVMNILGIGPLIAAMRAA